ncbi:26S proteasome non-ATPase regulatory subunit 11 [Phytophthora pseudosyringae]|uniref:26S proteasome non-ATPase regulatory subunit 11 n=1 Tax=Phytophthora pseudosyringae TaxID=221518 RepID=A0A8T1V2Q9_9STRA|nr:26S proteasome non-ATPase regulatory subunit 11 [Phytophthora pseudosyringae]
MEVLEKYPVQLDNAYLRSRTITCHWELVRPADYTHNFVIPPDLTQSMQPAVTNTRSEKNKPGDLDESVKKQGLALEVVASIDPKMWKFSGQIVGALTGFYAVKAKGKSWFQDRKWLEQDWRKIDSDVDIFAIETNSAEISADSVRDRHQAMANEVIAKFTSSRLRTEFVTLSGGGIISFEHIAGSLCRGWLNDSPIDFCLDTIGAAVGNYIGLSSLSWALGWPRTPKSRLADIKLIVCARQIQGSPARLQAVRDLYVHPVNIRANHWGFIIACLKYDKAQQKLRVHTYMYEPLIDDDYHEEMETVWDGIAKVEGGEERKEREGLRGLVERWHEELMPESLLVMDRIEWVEVSQQPDFACCGIMVVAQVHNYLTENLERQQYQVTKNDVRVMRLRMLWTIMCYSQERVMSDSDTASTSQIRQQLLDQL